MPKFQVELDNGKKYVVEADTQPTPEEVTSYLNQESGGGNSQLTDQSLGIEGGQLTGMERLSGGFRRPEDLQARRASQRVALGLAEDAPLEPTPETTGFFENLKDLPADILDAVAPSFPAIGNLIGGLGAAAVATPETLGAGTVPAYMAGAGAGAAVGEYARQFVGEQAFGFDQGTVGERAGKIALEGGLGAAFEGGGMAVNAAIKATKRGLITTANKLLSKKGIDGFVKVFGKLAPNVDYMQTQYAMDAMRHGDYSVMKEYIAKPDFARRFSKRLLFGKSGDLAENISQLARTKPGADVAIKSLFGEAGGILKLPDEVIDTIITKGAKGLQQFRDPKFILKFGQEISDTVNTSIDDIGSQLAKARLNLIQEAAGPGATVNLENLNGGLAQHLEQVGFLKSVPGGFVINKDFAATSTGKQQAGIFSDLVDRFFKKIEKGSLTQAEIDAARKASQGVVGRNALGDLLSTGTSGKETVYALNNSMHYSEFAKKLANIDVQISGNEFKSLGKLSPDLAVYLRGLRQFPKDIAEKVGNKSVPSLTTEFERLTEGLKPIREFAKNKDKVNMERFLMGLTSTNASEARMAIGEGVDRELSKKGINLLDSLKRFKASQVLKTYDDPLVRAGFEDQVIGTMKSVFKEGESSRVYALENSIDPYLPKGLQIIKNSRDHVVAGSLHKDAVSLLRARFLGNAAIQPILGSAIGGGAGAIIGGPVGAAIGATSVIAGGIGLQNPTLFRALLRGASKAGVEAIAQTPAKQIPQIGYLGAQQLLKGLLQKTQEQPQQ